MKNHKITVRDRSISVDDKRIVANNINIDTITLDLDEEWSGYTVYIVLGSGKNVYRAKWGYLPLTFPKPLMGKPGFIPVSIVGVSGSRRITTKRATNAFRVIPSGQI